MGQCRSIVSLRAEAMTEAKSQWVGLNTQMLPRHMLGKWPSLKGENDHSQCEQLYCWGRQYPISGYTNSGEAKGPLECMIVEKSVLGA